MSKTTTLAILAIIMMVGLVSAKDTFLQVYIGNSQHNMKVSLANFGYFKYGHTLTGRVQLGTVFTEWGDSVNQDRIPKLSKEDRQTNVTLNLTNPEVRGCKNDYQQFNDEYVAEYGSPIYFVERGNCSFVKKASGASKSGKMLIIADDSDQRDIDDIVMADDLSGNKIQMPVLMISKKDGITLKEFLIAELQDQTNNEDKRVFISITFNKPQEGSKAETQYWMIPSDKQSYSFIGTHSQFLSNLTLSDKIKFEPHFVFFRCDEKCKARNQNSTQSINDFCIFDGEYCHPDPDGNGPLTGADSIKQAVTELCIHNLFPQYFFLFFQKFKQCYVQDGLKLQDCSTATLQFIAAFDTDINKSLFEYKIKECVKDNTINNPVLMKTEYDLFHQQGLKFYPALFVNGDLFKGDFKDPDASEQFVCLGIENSEDLLECERFSNIKDNNKWMPPIVEENHSFIITMTCIVLLIFFIMGLFIYRRKMKMEVNKELAQQVDSAIQQYYALNNESKGSK